MSLNYNNDFQSSPSVQVLNVSSSPIDILFALYDKRKQVEFFSTALELTKNALLKLEREYAALSAAIDDGDTDSSLIEELSSVAEGIFEMNEVIEDSYASFINAHNEVIWLTTLYDDHKALVKGS